MKRNNKIKIAYDKESGETFDVSEQFTSGKKAFVAKQLYATKVWEVEELALKEQYYPEFNLKSLCCFECSQPLQITSRKGHVYLKHKTGSDDCELKSANPKELEVLYRIYEIKEGKEHYILKHKIGDYLRTVSGVEQVIVDQKYLFSELGKRKPDVLCHYKGGILVFELQLSKISLSYLINRTKFYQKKYKGKDVFLIWVLDKNNIKEIKIESEEDNSTKTKTVIEQSAMAMHIKYLNHYHNFFQFEPDKEGRYRFSCLFKQPFIPPNILKIHVKFHKEFIELDNLKFDFDRKVVYYKDTEELKELLCPKLEYLEKQKILELRQKYKEKEERERQEREQKQLQALRIEKFDAFKQRIIRIYKLLNSLSLLGRQTWGDTVKKEDLLEEVQNIDIDTCKEVIISKLISKEYPNYYELGISLDFYRLISSDLKNLNLYNLNKSLKEYIYHEEYINKKEWIEKINRFNVLKINNISYSIVDKKSTPYLFNNESYKKDILYYKKEDFNKMNTLFGFELKPILYYDKGDNINYTYLFDFSEITDKLKTRLSDFERPINLINNKIETAKLQFPIVLKLKIEEIINDLKSEIERLEEKADFLLNLNLKYENIFARCKHYCRCAYFDDTHKLCLKNYHSEKNYGNCTLSNRKLELYEIEKQNFCQFYRLYSEKEELDDILGI
ncbi:DUF6035 family protein [uncultured Dysgonomonas sp.]|uniref:DUF6035 family protein n=1 Tax=uncultured Dysgonomonas sp. TaxID=206096 RepID=UPI002804B937|nr:DUF6035 family protein [uncultured Dysgonomonas sp.]